jgi:hypothetical protein
MLQVIQRCCTHDYHGLVGWLIGLSVSTSEDGFVGCMLFERSQEIFGRIVQYVLVRVHCRNLFRFVQDGDSGLHWIGVLALCMHQHVVLHGLL